MAKWWRAADQKPRQTHLHGRGGRWVSQHQCRTPPSQMAFGFLNGTALSPPHSPLHRGLVALCHPPICSPPLLSPRNPSTKDKHTYTPGATDLFMQIFSKAIRWALKGVWQVCRSGPVALGRGVAQGSTWALTVAFWFWFFLLLPLPVHVWAYLYANLYLAMSMEFLPNHTPVGQWEKCVVFGGKNLYNF